MCLFYVFFCKFIQNGSANSPGGVWWTRVSQAMVPKHNVTSLSITVNRLLAIIVLANNGMFFRGLIAVLGCECVIKSFVASGPNGETATTRSYIVDIADNA